LNLLKLDIEKVLNVKRTELGFVSLLFLHNFFQGIGLALFFTAANAIFLAEASIKQLPLVYIFAAVLMIGVGSGYSYLEQRVNVKRLLMTVMVIIVVSIAAIRLGLLVSNGIWIAFAVIMWYRVTSLLNNLEFWGMTSMMLDVRQSKRLFGLISSGEVTAKLIGYFSIPLLVPIIGKNNLITIAIIAFAVCIWFLNRISKHPAAKKMDQKHERIEIEQKERLLSRYLKSDFIVLLSILSFIAVISFTFIDFSFLFNLQLKYKSGDEIAAFLGLFYGCIKAITFLVKIFLTGRIIDRFGVKNTMMFLPVLFLVITIIILISKVIFPTGIYMFALFAILIFLLEILRYSLFEPVFFSLFQPLSEKMRLFGHAIVNGFLNPIALGMAGICLLLLIHFTGIVDLGLISYILSACLIVWVFVVIITNRQYIVVLQDAVKKRYFEGSQMPVQGKLINSILIQKINSEYPEEVIYSAELLFKMDKTEKKDIVLRLLNNKNDEVIKYGLKKIEEYKIFGLEDKIKEIISVEKCTPVKEAAINAFCSNTEIDVSIIFPLLENTDNCVRKGAITGLLKNGGLEAVVLSGQQLLKLIQSEDESDNITAINIIGELKIKNFYQPILRFFTHSNPDVVRAAIVSSGQSLNPQFIESLIAFLKVRAYSELAANSLASFGEDALDEISKCVHSAKNEDIHVNQFVRICLVLGSIGTKRAHELLMHLSSVPIAKISTEAISSLKKSHYKANVNDTLIRDKFDEQFDQAVWLFNSQYVFEVNGRSDSFIYSSLKVELLNVKENMLNLLSLIYDTRTVLKAREGLLADFSERKANALEIIDNLISKRLSNKLSVVFEDLPLSERIKKIKSVYQVIYTLDEKAIISKIFTEKERLFNQWSQVSAIVAVYQFHIYDLIPGIFQFMDNDAKIIRESAADTVVKIIDDEGIDEDIKNKVIDYDKKGIIMSKMSENTLLDIEKVIILKSTSLFTETPENILVDIANIIVEERVEAGKTIFNKGELGTCMYIISEGEVKVHDNEMTFAILKNRDFFGELSLLDPEPRSASVTTTVDSLLLRLEQDAFYELMSERMEVAKGILKILCRRLRGQNEVINEMKAKMKS
jgi:ATP/ADP translocase